MTNAISIALSGLIAEGKRLAGIASNIANARDEGPIAPGPHGAPAYQPIDTVQVATPGGGTAATYRPASPATRASHNPDSPFANDQGLVAEPNVDVAGQMIDLIEARQAYQANLKTIEIADQMQRGLLKVIA